MTKKLLLTMFFVLFAGSIKAQLAKWDIYPKYREIKTIPEYKLVLSQSDDSTFVWTMDGRLLFATADVLHPFKEGKAVVTKLGTDEILGFYTIKGTFVKTENCAVACKYPFFSDGYLLTKQKDLYCYVDEQGKNVFREYIDASPFVKGMASVQTFQDWEKRKDPYCFYQQKGNEPLALWLEGEPVEPGKVLFASSLTVKGEGVVVIKDKVYFFDAQSKKLTPVYIADDEKSRKKPAVVDGEIYEWLIYESDDVRFLHAKMGKLGSVKIYFNERMCPVRAVFFNPEKTVIRNQAFAKEQTKEVKVTSYIDKSQNLKTKMWNVTYKGKNVLVHQFDDVIPADEKSAYVLYKGVWGKLSVIEDAGYQIRMNNGKDVGFRHRNHETEIRLDLPAYMSSKKISFSVIEEDRCHIDGTSVHRKDTENGNFVTYKCILDIPENLNDDLRDIEYNVSVNNEGLVHPQIPIKIKAWYIKRFNIDILEQSPIENGLFNFTINIDAQKAYDEDDYPFTLDVQSDSITVAKEKLSETRYRISLSSIKEGVNELALIIKEDGCPESVFPFEFLYVKPVRKTRTTKEVKEKAVVRKKTTVAPKNKQIDHPLMVI